MKTRQNSPLPETPAAPQTDRLAQKTNAKVEAAYDAELVRRFKAGDESAFTEIVQRHYSRIRSLANESLHNHADAEEVAQDTFIRAHRGLVNFRGDSSLTVWLYRIAINLARNRYWFYFRRHRHDMISIDQAAVEGSTLSLTGLLTDGTVAPRSESMTGEFVALVAECMQQLEESHREILTMRTMLHLSYEEIAASLRINVGTVKSRVARARERLRQLLHQMAPEFGRDSRLADYFEFNRRLPAPGFALA